MKLYLKRGVSAGEADFTVFDESGYEKYRAAAVQTKVTKNLNMVLLDSGGEVAAKIRRLPLVRAAAFVLRVKKSHITFVMLPTKNGIYSYFYGNNWHINGSVASKNFTIIDVDKTVIMYQRRHADHCTLEIPDEGNELYCVCASVCTNFINTIEKPVVTAANI